MDKKKQKQKQKQMYVQVVNLTEGKMYSLPTLYTDRVEACICGQNYVRDRHQENHDAVFYRILVAKDGKVAEPDYFTIVNDEDENTDDEACPHPEQECCEDCPFYSECWDFEDEDDEEPEHGESVFGGALVTELIELLKNKAHEAPEESNYLFEHWND